jgi:PTH1 family peptidyl-tRNA hydrolase
MRVLVGLGNPGDKYVITRHNAGFICVDEIARQIQAGAWSNFKGHLLAEARIGPEKCLLFKPQTHMNRSGEAVSQLLSYFDLSEKSMCVAADDVYIAPGSARVRQGGGDGGHNGWRSIGQHVEDHGFWRVRLGVGIYEQDPVKRMHQAALDDYVLERMNQHDLELLKKAIDKVAPNLIRFLEQGVLNEETLHI